MISRSFRTATLLGALVAVSALTACAPLLITGAVVGGSMIATDRRTSGAQLEDQAIELKALTRVNEVLGDRGHVSVTSYGRQALITGEVPTEADKVAVAQAIARIENVQSIVDELAVMSPTSITSRSNDAIITGKVKASLIDAKDVLANAFKVVTERGVVYLMGRVTEREANRAAEVARGVGGVQKVVKVFDVVSEAELADLDPKTAPTKK
jgi:osmotically-inducible protein OsmY